MDVAPHRSHIHRLHAGRRERVAHGFRGALDGGSDAPHTRDAKRRDIPFGDEPAVGEHRDVIGGLLDLAQHVGAEEHRLARVARLAHHGEELALDERVEAAGRLVEHEELGPVHEGLHEPELLLVALGEGAHRAGEVQTQALREGFDHARFDRPADLGEVAQERAALHASFQAQLSRHESDASSQRRAAGTRRLPEHSDLAVGGPDHIQQQPQGRRLARAVGADEAEDRSSRDGQIQAVQRDVRTVGLAQAAGVDRRRIRHARTLLLGACRRWDQPRPVRCSSGSDAPATGLPDRPTDPDAGFFDSAAPTATDSSTST